MKKLILVALILQLVIIITDIDGAAGRSVSSSGSKKTQGQGTQNQYEFGDILAFPRVYVQMCIYTHYAIYVGPVNESRDNDVGQGDNDIFHRTHERGTNGLYCGFAKLQDTKGKSQERVDNYLEEPGLLHTEDLEWLSTQTGRQDIVTRINELKHEENCGRYRLTANNCEHLATYVRYGVSVSFQDGALAGPFQKRLKKKKNAEALKKIEEKIEELRKNQEAQRQCASSPVVSTSGRNTIMLSAYLALLSSFLI